MKRLPLMLLPPAGLAAATANAQTAADPAPAVPPAAPIPEETPKATSEAPAADNDDKRLSDTTCLRETGSRITKRAGKPRCTAQPGRAYTKDDLDRTGHMNLSDALRTLDPSIR